MAIDKVRAHTETPENQLQQNSQNLLRMQSQISSFKNQFFAAIKKTSTMSRERMLSRTHEPFLQYIDYLFLHPNSSAEERLNILYQAMIQRVNGIIFQGLELNIDPKEIKKHIIEYIFKVSEKRSSEQIQKDFLTSTAHAIRGKCKLDTMEAVATA